MLITKHQYKIMAFQPKLSSLLIDLRSIEWKFIELLTEKVTLGS